VFNATFSNISSISTNLSPIRRGFAPGFVNHKEGAFDSQLQVIKLTSYVPMVGGSLRVLRLLPPLKTGRHDIAEILLKAVLVIGLYELLGNLTT
jgi:hypothetical protein